MVYFKDKKTLKRILDCIDDGVFVLDREGTILLANKGTEKSGGIDAEELIGQSIIKLAKEGYCSESVIEKVVAGGSKQSLIQTVNDGKELLVTGIPLFNEEDGLELIIACERDMSELYSLREQLTKEEAKSKKQIEEIEFLRESQTKTDDIIAESAEMQKQMILLNKISKVNTSVLLRGESGVGKEVFAKYIYQNSDRNRKPFIKVNCGAIPENLIESELFGYEEGAFTGAKKEGRSGLFELASDGILFLDEIGELPLSAQVKVLRAIQEREILRVGGSDPVKLNTRLIFATNADLEKMVETHQFREDLYYRINVIEVFIPSLRERKEDIAPLVRHFIRNFNHKYAMNKKIKDRAIAILEGYNWPGNIRELENVVERLILMSQSDTIDIDDVKPHVMTNKMVDRPKMNSSRVDSGLAPRDYEKRYLAELMERYSGNTQLVAEELNTTRSTVNRKLKKYDLR